MDISPSRECPEGRKEIYMAVTENITKRVKHLTVGGRTITLNENESFGQALERAKNSQTNVGGSEDGEEKRTKEESVEGAK